MEQRKDTSDEHYVLGFIAGLCQQEPRDQLLLGDMLLYLREAQAARRQSQSRSVGWRLFDDPTILDGIAEKGVYSS